MEALTQFILQHAQHAHWLIFGALMLAGLNIPVSEDLMIILSATLAATAVPENTYILFLAVFLGCYLSDWVCYWIGRGLGPKLWKISWFAKRFSIQKVEKIETYYQKYGFWTLLIGRLIPFGVRNALFLTAGLGRMSFPKFLISDGIACMFSNTLLFWLAYSVGKNYQVLLEQLKRFNIFLFCLFAVAVIIGVWYKRWKKPAV